MADPEWKKWAAQPKYAAAANSVRKTVHTNKFWQTAEDLHFFRVRLFHTLLIQCGCSNVGCDLTKDLPVHSYGHSCGRR